MSREFDLRRAAWLAEVHQRTAEGQRRATEDVRPPAPRTFVPASSPTRYPSGCRPNDRHALPVESPEPVERPAPSRAAVRKAVAAWERDRARRGGIECHGVFENTATGSATAAAVVAPVGPPPPPTAGPALSSTPWEDFEFHRVQLPACVLVPLDMGRAVFVPSGAMFFGGDRVWRCEVAP